MRMALATLALAAALTACSSGSQTPTVPSLHRSGSAGASPPSTAEALHLAGQCIRDHGIPDFADPTLNAAGQVTFDKAQLMAAPKAAQSQALSACRVALGEAGIGAGRSRGMGGRPSPAQLRKIVAFAGCMRAHGLPTLSDPNPVTGALSLPAGVAKSSPVVQRAFQACRHYIPGGG